MRAIPHSRIAFIWIAGLCARLAWWWFARPEPVSDFEYIRRLAEDLVDHGQFGFPHLESGRLPLYPFVLSLLMRVSPAIDWLATATVVMSSLLVPVVALLTSRLGFATGVSIAAAWIIALNPVFVYYAPVLATEHLFALFLVAGLAIAARTGPSGSLSRDLALSAAAGGLLGLSALSRGDAVMYLPVFIVLVWRVSASLRWLSVAALVVALSLVVTPWYVRNRVLFGPGAGLSTSAGPTFYFAHKDGPAGWTPLAGTPLEGLNGADRQRRAYELGWEYMKRIGPVGVAADVARATVRLYSPLHARYTLSWSTQRLTGGPDEFTPRPLPGRRIFEALSGFYALVLAAAIWSVRLVRHFPPNAALALYGLVLMNWLGHAWIFVAEARYRYAAEVVLCILAAMTIRGGIALAGRIGGRAGDSSRRGQTTA